MTITHIGNGIDAITSIAEKSLIQKLNSIKTIKI